MSGVWEEYLTPGIAKNPIITPNIVGKSPFQKALYKNLLHLKGHAPFDEAIHNNCVDAYKRAQKGLTPSPGNPYAHRPAEMKNPLKTELHFRQRAPFPGGQDAGHQQAIDNLQRAVNKPARVKAKKAVLPKPRIK
jgi:hypothetical protein